VVSISNTLRVVSADPDDDTILECALVTPATHVVTGDRRHLLPLRGFRGIQIVTPREFLALLLPARQTLPGGPPVAAEGLERVSLHRLLLRDAEVVVSCNELAGRHMGKALIRAEMLAGERLAQARGREYDTRRVRAVS
jgi:hypothetical protein